MINRRRTKNKPRYSLTTLLPLKAHLVLNILLAALILIGVRAWYLSVIDHEEKLEEATRPQKRVLTEAAKRGTIRDRFNIPLAINKMQYQASVIYSQIQQLPAFKWEVQPNGTRFKRYVRKEYIKKLSALLAEELSLDRERVEDLIYSKAALYHQVPFQLKNNLSESEYYRLKMLEKDWVGLVVQRQPLRSYPQGRVASDVIGYMGPIDRREYENLLREIRGLEEYLQEHLKGEDIPLPENIASTEEAHKRLQDLREKAYSANDYIGKTGIEGRYEQSLRGFQGTRHYSSDARGNFLREIPGGRDPLPGQRILLSLSAELQSFSEEILIANEQVRQTRYTKSGSLDKSIVAPKQPWIKGGAIIAIEPQTGEVLALASYPRYDPNDFQATGEDRKKILRWFETESYLASVWEQRVPLEREIYDPLVGGSREESVWLTWDAYLDRILPLEGPLRQSVEKLATIADAVALQRSEPDSPAASKYLGMLDTPYDKTLLYDIAALAVWEEPFSDDLLESCGSISISDHKEHCCAYAQLKDLIKQHCKALFHKTDFAEWRQKNEKDFLKAKRLDEKQKKQYPKPYIDLLDSEERKQFERFWTNHSQDILSAFILGFWGATEPDDPVNTYLDIYKSLRTSTDLDPKWQRLIDNLSKAIQSLPELSAYTYLSALRSFNDLNRPLKGKYRILRSDKGIQLEKHLAMGFYPKYGYGFARSQAYRQATTQGSIFKIITAYAALVQHYEKNPHVQNPLIINDAWRKSNGQVYVGDKEDGTPIPQMYKGGRLPKSLNKNIGKIDLVKAIVHSSNPYFSLLAGDMLDSPEDLAEAARLFSYGSPTGIELPGEIGGNIPNDLSTNRTGLYAMAIGQHTLVVTPLQAAVMLCAIANGGKVIQPKIVSMLAGRQPQRTSGVGPAPRFTYQESLNLIGIDFPLFSAVAQRDNKPCIKKTPTTVRHEAFMPKQIRNQLLEGMRQVAQKTLASSLKALKRIYRRFPQAVIDYETLGDELVGKTSTAESVDALDLEIPPENRIYNHLWFGGILFGQGEQSFIYKDPYGNPELVVVVYLRYGGYGKDVAPLAAQVAQRWRAIKASHALMPEQ